MNIHAELFFEEAKESLIESIRVVHRLSEEDKRGVYNITMVFRFLYPPKDANLNELKGTFRSSGFSPSREMHSIRTTKKQMRILLTHGWFQKSLKEKIESWIVYLGFP